MLKYCLCLIVGLVSIGTARLACPPAPTTVRQYLFCDYDKSEVPNGSRSNRSVEARVKLILKTVKYDDDESKLTIFGVLSVIWNDDRLSWEDTEYPQDDIYVSSASIWKPDLALYNRFDYSGNPTETDEVNCVVSVSGDVFCIFPMRYESLCLPDLTRYPFDRQNCSMTMGSWIHSEESLNLTFTFRPFFLESYERDNQWTLKETSAWRNPGDLYCCPNFTTPTLVYEFLLERNTGGHVSLVIVPAVGMVIMSLLTLCLNSTEIERVYLICLNLLIHTFYIEYVSWQVPISGAATPLLLIYARDSLLLVCFGLILTVLERRLIRTKSVCPPWFVKSTQLVLTSRFGYYLFIFDETKKIGEVSLDDEEESTKAELVLKKRNEDWFSFSLVLDKLCFLAYSAFYFYMFLAFIL